VAHTMQCHARAWRHCYFYNLPLLGNRPKSAKAMFCSFCTNDDAIVGYRPSPCQRGRQDAHILKDLRLLEISQNDL
jgi:hypothetical protein